MFCIEQKYGNDGYAVWIKILRQLAVTNYHYLNLSDQAEFMFLSSKCRVSELMLENIINDLCKLGEFHAELWAENRILFNEKFVSTIQDAYNKRNSNCITLPGLFHLLSSLGVLKTQLPVKKDSHNPQSKIKESKGKEREVTHPLCLWIKKELPIVSKMKVQLTDPQAEKIVADFDRKLVQDVLESMENFTPLLKRYNNVNRTIRGWIKIRQAKNPELITKPKDQKTDQSAQQDFYSGYETQNIKAI